MIKIPKLNKMGLLLLVVMSVILISGCSEELEDYFTNDNLDKEITHHTSGIINSDSRIAVRFREEQVTEEYVGENLEEDVFTFTPKLEGEAFWEDERTVVFKPDEFLYQKKSWHVELDLEELFPVLDEVNPTSKEFHIETLGQEVVDLQAGFEIDENNASDLLFAGQVELAEKSDLASVEESLQLEKSGEELELEIENQNDLIFSFESSPLTRAEGEVEEFELTLEQSPLNLRADIAKTYQLNPSDEPLYVERIVEERRTNNSELRIVFSDILKADRDYQGYFNLEPSKDVEVWAENDTLVISGDFEPGDRYNIELFSGIESAFGQRLREDEEHELEIEIADKNPAIEFVDSGLFLTTANQEKVAFRSINVERARVKVRRVAEDDLIDFFEDHSYRPSSDNIDDYNSYNFTRTGEVVAEEILDIGDKQNKWVQSKIDLSSLIPDQRSGLYILELDFSQDQALYMPDDWSNWQRRRHMNSYSQALKHLLVSDIGITAKEIGDEINVFVTNLLTTEVLENSIVEIKDESGEIISSGYTDEQGFVQLDSDSEAEYIEVRSGDNYALMKLNQSKLNKSLFDIGGIERQDGLQAFIYSERGVYRPGDDINLSAIIRNEAGSFPDNHPVNLRLYNPQGRLSSEVRESEAEDGFYNFELSTQESDLTGDWKVELEVGGNTFEQQLKIEEIVPYRIRVNLESEQENLSPEQPELNFRVESEYLFGAPASGLDSQSRVVIEPYEKSFSAYENFIFTNQSKEFDLVESPSFNQELDEQGLVELDWELPELGDVPSALRASIESRVLERGGRAVPQQKKIPIEYYDRYVGIEELSEDELSIGSQADFNLALVSDDGEAIANQDLEYRIYRMRRYWWWEYDSQDSFRRHYKSNDRTELVREGNISTDGEGMAFLEHTLDDYGEMLLEVEDPEGGHQAGYFFRSYWWGDEAEGRSADIVNLSLDQEEYLPDETAELVVDTPPDGRALITVEKGEEILYQTWEELEDTQSIFTIPVKEEYTPNAYVSVVLYQGQEGLDNDLPLRMYGVTPLKVNNEDAQIDFELETPESISPEEEFEIEVATKDGNPAQFTIAVVDDGLLDLTNFKTPEPWEFFFQKERLLTTSYDNFSDVIDLNHSYTHNLFSIGGDAVSRSSYREEQQARSDDADRFEPVSLFKGPIQTDAEGRAQLSFELPNYIGSVRAMVVGANEDSYGSAESRIEAKSPLMVMPTLPRVLGPTDKIRVPVTVFALEDDVGEVEVEIDISGNAYSLGDSTQTINFNQAEEKEVYFELVAEEAIGRADIEISAYSESADYQADSKTEMPIRAYNPYIYDVEQRVVDSNSSVEFDVPEAGIAGTNSAQISVSARKGLDIDHRLQWLIRYPYGCLEQNVSSVFPQLYLANIFDFDSEELTEIDQNINDGIERIRDFQLSNGGLAYWPTGSSANQWATNYAGHFLLEAKEKGYHVPSDLLSNWYDYQKEAARSNQGDKLTRAYRMYLLALGGQAEVSAMNYMRESELHTLDNREKHLLAGAYELIGESSTAEEILDLADLEVEDYFEFSGTFGSSLRDQAIMLDVLTLLEEYDSGLILYNEIAEKISSDDWYSTQTTAYSLLSLTKYAAAVSEGEELSGEVVLADSEVKEFSTQEAVANISLGDSFGQEIEFRNNSETPLYTTLEWEGVPKRGEIAPEQNKLTLDVNWFDEQGEQINPEQLRQGESIYAHFRVGKESRENIEEVALNQILPSGWEIENLRLSDARLPSWTNDLNLDTEDYLDIRDDRIMWFFDMERGVDSYDFVVKINAVTVGEFYLPPTLVEAMYNNDYKVTTESRKVEVLPR